MTKLSDQQLAAFILDARRDGLKLAQGRFSKKHNHRAQWFLYFLMPAALVAIGIIGNSPAFAGFGVGLCVGTLSYHWQTRDRTTDSWQFYLRVLDWEKVERIATGKE